MRLSEGAETVSADKVVHHFHLGTDPMRNTLYPEPDGGGKSVKLYIRIIQ